MWSPLLPGRTSLIWARFLFWRTHPFSLRKIVAQCAALRLWIKYDKLPVIVTETEGKTMTKKYKVTLTAEERALLKDILNKGKHTALRNGNGRRRFCLPMSR
jgi:isochorismate hydrolase